ncbi:hypothetical protein, partial [Robertmurraya korlensis]|uniref:hypothetical protein n=1 Tax=Robertmurraya korlensis TaxID=519977 RepID=UPI0012ED2F5A
MQKKRERYFAAAILSLIVFTWSSLFITGTPVVIAAEKPKPEQKENKNLDNVLTGVKVGNGVVGTQIASVDLLLNTPTSTSGKITQTGLLLTAGSKIIGDATGNKVFEGVGDLGDGASKIIELNQTYKQSYTLIDSSPSSSKIRTYFNSAKTTFTKPVLTLSNGSRNWQLYKNEYGVARGLKNISKDVWKASPVLSKVLAPLAVIGGTVDLVEGFTKKGFWNKTEKFTSAASNFLAVAGLLAAGTAAAPFLITGAVVLGVGSLAIKYRKEIGNAAKKAWNFTKNTAIKAYSFAKKVRSSVKKTTVKAA